MFSTPPRILHFSPELQRFAASASPVSQASSTIGYLAGALLAALVIVRLARRTLFLASFTAAGFGSILLFFAATRGAPAAVLGEAALSAAQSTFMVVSITMLAEAHPVRRRALSLFVLMYGVGLGHAVSPTLAAAASQYFAQWRLIFLFAALAALLFGTVMYRFLFSRVIASVTESEPYAAPRSWRDWVPEPLLAGCLLAAAIASQAELLRSTELSVMTAEFVRRSGAATEVMAKIGWFFGAQFFITILALVAGIVYGDRRSAKGPSGHVVFLLPLMTVGPLLAHYPGSLQDGWMPGLSAAGFGGATGLFNANLLAAMLDVTSARNWARSIALLVAVQTLAPALFAFVYAWPWLLTVSGCKRRLRNFLPAQRHLQKLAQQRLRRYHRLTFDARTIDRLIFLVHHRLERVDGFRLRLEIG